MAAAMEVATSVPAMVILIMTMQIALVCVVVCHILGLYITTAKVIRVTFSAELPDGCDAAWHRCEMPYKPAIDPYLIHVKRGDSKVNLLCPALLYMDAVRVYVAFASAHMKVLVDNAMLAHVQYIREVLATRVLTVSG